MKQLPHNLRPCNRLLNPEVSDGRNGGVAVPAQLLTDSETPGLFVVDLGVGLEGSWWLVTLSKLDVSPAPCDGDRLHPLEILY